MLRNIRKHLNHKIWLHTAQPNSFTSAELYELQLLSDTLVHMKDFLRDRRITFLLPVSYVYHTLAS